MSWSCTWATKFRVAALAMLILGMTWQPMDAARLERDMVVVRVIVPAHERAEARLSPYGPGYEQELLAAFLDFTGREAAYRFMDDPNQALLALENGEADLAVGFSFALGQRRGPNNIDSPVQAGPVYATYTPAVIARGEEPDQEQGGNGWFTREPDAVACTDPALTESLSQGVGWENQFVQACQAMDLASALDGVEGEEFALAVVDEDGFRLWQPFYQELHVEAQGEEEVALRWFWRGDREILALQLDTFWADQEVQELAQELDERYFGFLPSEPNISELEHILATMTTEVDQYADVIAREAANNGMDPLLITAVIYRESRFRADARSHTGVRGLMQLTSSTASMLGVSDRLDPEQSIQGGSAYLRMIWDELEEFGLDPWERWCFTLAGYNQGPGNLRRAIRLAQNAGGEGKTWNELRQAYLRMNSGCRGREAVRFVDSVRYYYYILHGLVVLSRPEAQHLAALVQD
ncbi:MAG: transglycosylase [Desulfovibrio sp.]|nr:MAG: transglycosylase [Desulfovibrio sp.]